MSSDPFQVCSIQIITIKLTSNLYFIWPGSLTQMIRNFAKGLEGWLSSAMTGCPETIMNIKVRWYSNTVNYIIWHLNNFILIQKIKQVLSTSVMFMTAHLMLVFVCSCVPWALLLRRSVATLLLITWRKLPEQCCRTRLKLTKCLLTSTGWTSITCKNR